MGIGLTLLLSGLPTPAYPSSDEYCSQKHAKKVVRQFIRAHNHGAFAKLDTLFAKEPEFSQYQVAPIERPYPLSLSRETLIDYFKERHRVGDHIKFTSFELEKERNGIPENLWGFRFTLVRTTSDIAPWGSGTFSGKGVVDCVLHGWTMSWET